MSIAIAYRNVGTVWFVAICFIVLAQIPVYQPMFVNIVILLNSFTISLQKAIKVWNLTATTMVHFSFTYSLNHSFNILFFYSQRSYMLEFLCIWYLRIWYCTWRLVFHCFFTFSQTFYLIHKLIRTVSSTQSLRIETHAALVEMVGMQPSFFPPEVCRLILSAREKLRVCTDTNISHKPSNKVNSINFHFITTLMHWFHFLDSSTADAFSKSIKAQENEGRQVRIRSNWNHEKCARWNSRWLVILVQVYVAVFVWSYILYTQ